MISFPVHRENCSPDVDRSLPALQALFSKVVRPGDVSDAHVAALNIEFVPETSVAELLPQASNGTSYVPSPEPQQTPAKASYSDAVRSDADSSRRRKDFEAKYAELQIDNDLAFRTINRTVKGPGRPPRLAMRKFWEGLETMSRYWDCSLDCYFTSNSEDHEQKSTKRQRTGSHTSYPDSTAVTPGTSPPASASPQNGATHEGSAMSIAQNTEVETVARVLKTAELVHVEDGSVSASRSITPESHSRTRYRGRRNANGSEMPDKFRTETVQGFIEGAVWPFQTTLSAPRVIPRVRFNKLTFPIRLTAAVYGVPSDRTKARMGWLVGPIMGIQTRPETDFVKSTTKERSTAARLDSLREIGALLQLAQERHREGKTELRPGEGKWWTTKARWGGGLGGEPQDEVQDADVHNGDALQAAEEPLGAARQGNGNKDRKGRMKQAPAMMWKELKCGGGSWDTKTEYKAIGKPPGSLYDEVGELCTTGESYVLMLDRSSSYPPSTTTFPL